jgi:uncharacterized protein (TIGR02646 family)
MRYITKSVSPPELEVFKRKNPKKTYKDLNGNDYVKNSIKTSLLNEQNNRCCYCEQKLHTESSHHTKSSHIEHIKPQSKFPKESLDYDNLLASCNGNNKSESCGHKKDDWYCENTFVHPLKTDCLEHFKFRANGEMLGKTEFGKITVQQLGLNSRHLQSKREGVLRQYRSLSIEDICLVLGEDNTHEFISAINEVFEIK